MHLGWSHISGGMDMEDIRQFFMLVFGLLLFMNFWHGNLHYVEQPTFSASFSGTWDEIYRSFYRRCIHITP